MSVEIGKSIRIGGNGMTEIYTQCQSCGCQVMAVLESGTKGLSMTFGLCGRCNEGRLDIAIQPEGTGAPSWWKKQNFKPIKSTGSEFNP